MNHVKRTATIALSLLLAVTALAAPKNKREKLVDRIVTSEYALEEIMAQPENAIPAAVLQEAKGIILTVNYRGSFFFGGHGGLGVLVAKNPLTGEWGVPAFVHTGGANFGFQFGVKELDTVYVIMDDETIKKAYTGRFDLSADASAVAGPRGVLAEAIGDGDYQNANILVYTTTKGLFAGVAIKAGWVAPDNSSNKLFYSTEYTTPEIVLSDWFEMPREAQALIQRLNFYMKGTTS